MTSYECKKDKIVTDKKNKYVVICDTDIPGHDGDHKTSEMMTSTLQGPSW